MLNKILMIVMSFASLIVSVLGFFRGYYHGGFIDLYGTEAYVAEIFSFSFSIIFFTNEIHPWIKWLRSKDWPFLCFLIIANEFIVRALFNLGCLIF